MSPSGAKPHNDNSIELCARQMCQLIDELFVFVYELFKLSLNKKL